MRRTAGFYYFCFSALLGSALAAGCVGFSTPDWIGGFSQEYPNDRYLLGVGSGESRKAAEDNALGALSRIFRADVRQQTRELEKYFQRDAGRRTLISHSVNIDQLTTVSSDRVLEDAKIEAVWVHPKTGRYYALALIDRVHAETALRDRLRELDGAARAYLDPSRKSVDKIQAVRGLHQAVKTLLLRETTNADLRIISPSGRGMPAEVNLAEVSQDLQDFLKNHLRIGVEVAGPHAEEIRGAFLQELTEKGFAVIGGGPDGGPSPAPPDLLIKGTVGFQTDEKADPPFVHWDASFQILETETGRVLGGLVKSGREGHLTSAEAESRAVRAVQKEFGEDLTLNLTDLLYGESD
jgi:LPP20 lipoprotein